MEQKWIRVTDKNNKIAGLCIYGLGKDQPNVLKLLYFISKGMNSHNEVL